MHRVCSVFPWPVFILLTSREKRKKKCILISPGRFICLEVKPELGWVLQSGSVFAGVFVAPSALLLLLLAQPASHRPRAWAGLGGSSKPTRCHPCSGRDPCHCPRLLQPCLGQLCLCKRAGGTGTASPVPRRASVSSPAQGGASPAHRGARPGSWHSP